MIGKPPTRCRRIARPSSCHLAANRGNDGVLAVCTPRQQLQIASQNFRQLVRHPSKHPPCCSLQAKPLGQRSGAAACVSLLAMDAFPLREERLAMLLYLLSAWIQTTSCWSDVLHSFCDAGWRFFGLCTSKKKENTCNQDVSLYLFFAVYLHCRLIQCFCHVERLTISLASLLLKGNPPRNCRPLKCRPLRFSFAEWSHNSWIVAAEEN